MFVDVTVIVVVAKLPGRTLKDVGEASRIKSVAAVITKVAVAECLSPLQSPVTVKVNLPPGVVAWVLTVRIEVAVPFAGGVTGLLLKVNVLPEGSPETVRFTGSSKPFIDSTVTV